LRGRGSEAQVAATRVPRPSTTKFDRRSHLPAACIPRVAARQLPHVSFSRPGSTGCSLCAEDRRRRLPYLRSASQLSSPMQRVCQQRLPFGLRLGDQRTAVDDGDKASGHVVDEKRDYSRYGGRRLRSACRRCRCCSRHRRASRALSRRRLPPTALPADEV
jgi:hypothetical protein